MKLTLWKPFGITSNYFTEQLIHKYNCKKICYAGRLDPLACGVMLILTEDDVKTMNAYLNHNKTYEFDIIIGLSTSSSDIAGTIIENKNMADYHYDELQQSLETFIGIYTTQTYPLISSFVVKHPVHGRKPLWWYAKNNIDIDAPTKNISIYDYKIHNIQTIQSNEFYKNALDRLHMITNTKTIDELDINSYINYYKNADIDSSQCDYKIKIHMTMSVSSGFYIRQFCNDFGKYINSPCIAFDITRTNIC